MAERGAWSDLPVPTSLRIDVDLGSPPRAAVFRTKVRVGFIAGAVAYVAVAVLVAILTTREAGRLERLRDHGVVTDAVVVKKWTSGSKSKTRHVSYTFTCDGRRCTDDDSVSSSSYDKIVLGQRIRITYEPADPENTEVGSVTQDTIDRHWLFVGWTGGGVGLIVLGFMFFAYLHHHRRRALLGEGELTSARIESVGKASRKGKVCKVVFEVTGVSDLSGSHKCSVSQKLLVGVGVGDEIPCLVMRHDPRRAAPLALCLASCRLE
jgi:hypothetical protein